MRAWMLALTLVSATACYFNGDFPDDIPCSPSNTCPPNQSCVPGEHMCRYACGANNSCPGTHNGNLVCDSDHFCRPGCGGVSQSNCSANQPPNNLLGACPTGQVCDSMTNICRLVCGVADLGSACSTGFSCATLPGSTCGGCRPQ